MREGCWQGRCLYPAPNANARSKDCQKSTLQGHRQYTSRDDQEVLGRPLYLILINFQKIKKITTMKTKMTLLTIFLCLLNFGCKEQDPTAAATAPVAEVDLIRDEFPDAKKEVEQTLADIMESIKDGNIDKLISFHAYGPKFTEFKDGEPRNGGDDNEAFERNTFSAVTEVVKMGMDDLKIAVYDNVANATFHTDFHLKFGEDLVVVNEQISLLFVKNKDGEWKIVHEHHSPLKSEES